MVSSDEESSSSSGSDSELEQQPTKKRKQADSSAVGKPTKKKKKKKILSLIDDSAVHSGSEDDEDEEDDDEEGEDGINDYERDGFVVDEVDDKARGDLEDSDDDDDDDSDDSDDGGRNRSRRRKKNSRIRKNKGHLDLLDDDLDLIAESRGEAVGATGDRRSDRVDARREDKSGRVRAKDAAGVQNQLFTGDDARRPEQRGGRRRQREDFFDEDAMEDFIDDDLYDNENDRHRGDRRGARMTAYDADDDVQGEEVTEENMRDAVDIFGTEYLDTMKGDRSNDDKGHDSYHEKGVGVAIGVDGDDDNSYYSDNEDLDDENDLFNPSDNEEDEGDRAARRDKARVKREMRELRRKQDLERRNQARKARLRKAFEPVHLAENFCTDRDDQIRRVDVPERFFDWKTPFHKADLEEEALWIMNRVPEIRKRFFRASSGDDELMAPTADTDKIDDDDEEAFMDPTEKRQKAVLDSIGEALTLFHQDKLEPEFVRRYREDIVTDKAVRDNLFRVMDEDSKYNDLVFTREKTQTLLERMADGNVRQSAKTIVDAASLTLRSDLKAAQDRLEESLQDEEKAKQDLQEVEQTIEDTNKEADDDDDDDELFGNDDDDEEKQAKLAEKNREKARLEEHLATLQSLVQERAERVATLDTTLKSSSTDPSSSSSSTPPATLAKQCLSQLFSNVTYNTYLSTLTEHRHIVDVGTYLGLVQEGNDAIASNNSNGSSANQRNKAKRRRTDYYRTCVSEGLRKICYKFVLSPYKVGIKLEDTFTNGVFQYDKALDGEEEGDSVDPARWCPPPMDDFADPLTFANDLVGSGELVLLSAMSGGDTVDAELRDPLKGCRYVAAMELANEPRIKRYCRQIYRRKALLTTRPTNKGLHEIHTFHEHYGLHLIKEKPLHEHFGVVDSPVLANARDLRPDQREGLEEDLCRQEKDSCLQYLRILEAERSGNVSTQIHMPHVAQSESSMTAEERTNQLDYWYKPSRQNKITKQKPDLSPFMDVLEQVYLSPDQSESEEWAEERRKILRMALISFLLPQFEAEVRQDLRESAYKTGDAEVSKALEHMAMEGPYRPNHLFGENRFLVPTGDLPIVGVCVANDGKDPTYLVAVSEKGEVTDNIAIPGGSNFSELRENINRFLMQTRPAAVVVGTGGHKASKMMAQKLGECITEATEKWNNRHIQGENEDDDDYEMRKRDLQQKMGYDSDDGEYEEETWKCNVDLVDDNVSQLFGRSRVRGEKEFPDFHMNLRCAISIARYAQGPLAELCYAWSVASDSGMFGIELLHLNVHPMQRLVPKNQLLKGYERVLCKVVAAVGVDLNLACEHDHFHGMLQFVAGFGPRKALALKQSLVRIGGVIDSRKALLQKRLIGPTVYNNSVAFLRIRERDKLDGQVVHPLDDTRLHPDVYHKQNWASKMAMDALDEKNKNENNDVASNKALKDVMADSQEEVRRLSEAVKAEYESANRVAFISYNWDPKSLPENAWHDKVGLLDLEMFAQMIEKQYGMGKWLSHLNMIVWEFRLPFEDPRKPMEPISGDKKFRLLTGEDDLTLCPGKEVTGRVVRINDYACTVKLDCDIDGDIPLRNLADGQVESVQEVVSPNMVITALITEVKKDHMKVELTLKHSDFQKPPSHWPRPESLPDLDKFFNRLSAMRIEDDRKAERDARLELILQTKGPSLNGKVSSRSSRVSRRACTHPAFRNKKQNEIDDELKEAGESMVGQALIRPSSSKSDALVVHWVVKLGAVKVIEVVEDEKDTDASIGNVLKIKDEVYGTIDELIGRYIEPMNSFVDEVLRHRKFMKGSESVVDAELKKMKNTAPKGFHYCLCWSKYPGTFNLRFIRTVNVRYHRIDVSPNGFVWVLRSGNQCHDTVDRMINAFKKNPSGETVLQPRAVEPSRVGRWGAKTPSAPETTAHSQASGWGSQPPPPAAAPAWRPAPPSLPPRPPGVPTAGHPPPPPGPPPSFGGFSGRPPPPGAPPPTGYPPFQRPPPPGMPPPAGGFPPTHGSVQS